jgi:hypothetical protein
MSIDLFKNINKNSPIKDLSKRSSIFKIVGSIAFISSITATSLFLFDSKSKNKSDKTHNNSNNYDRYQSLDTEYSIDDYINKFVSKYSGIIEISNNTEKVLLKNKTFIKKYSNENNIPTDLLATIIANESETRDISTLVKDQIWNLVKRFSPNYSLRKNSTEGISQLRISTAAYYLKDLVKNNGMNYILNKLNNIDEIESNERLEKLLHKFEGVGKVSYFNNENKPVNETATGVLNDMSDYNRKFLIKNVSKILSNDEISIELGSKHLKYLTTGVKNVFSLTDKDFISNPIALMINFRAYTQTVSEIDVHNKTPRKKGWYHRSSSALSLLKSNSKIKKMFSDERYLITSDKRYIQNIGDDVGIKTIEYKKIEKIFGLAYSTISEVGRSEYLISAYNSAINIANIELNEKRKIEFIKIAAYSIHRANTSLQACGVDSVKFKDYNLINLSMESLGCDIIIKPNNKGSVNKFPVMSCINLGYSNLVDKYNLRNQKINIPYFGKNRKLN